MSDINTIQEPTQELYRKPLVLKITGLSHSTLYHLMKEGRFPSQIKIGVRAVAWRKTDIESWLNNLTH